MRARGRRAGILYGAGRGRRHGHRAVPKYPVRSNTHTKDGLSVSSGQGEGKGTWPLVADKWNSQVGVDEMGIVAGVKARTLVARIGGCANAAGNFTKGGICHRFSGWSRRGYSVLVEPAERMMLGAIA